MVQDAILSYMQYECMKPTKITNIIQMKCVETEKKTLKTKNQSLNWK